MQGLEGVVLGLPAREGQEKALSCGFAFAGVKVAEDASLSGIRGAAGGRGRDQCAALGRPWWEGRCLRVAAASCGVCAGGGSCYFPPRVPWVQGGGETGGDVLLVESDEAWDQGMCTRVDGEIMGLGTEPRVEPVHLVRTRGPRVDTGGEENVCRC